MILLCELFFLNLPIIHFHKHNLNINQTKCLYISNTLEQFINLGTLRVTCKHILKLERLNIEF